MPPTNHLESRTLQIIIVTALIAFMAIITLPASWRESPTSDEGNHLYSGYSHLRFGDLTLNAEHPPLVKEISALPLLFLHPNYSAPPPLPENLPDFRKTRLRSAPAATRFLYEMGNDPDLMIFLGRVAMTILMLVGVWILYIFALNLFGKSTAILALLVMAISPVVLAYGRLITFDMPCATFMLLTLYCYWIYLSNQKKTWLFFTGVSAGLALLTQNTALMLIPSLVVLALIHGKRQGKGRAGRVMGKNLVRVLAIFLIAVALIGVYYGTHTSNMHPNEVSQTIKNNLPPDSTGEKLANMVYKVSPPLALYTTSILRNYYFNKEGGFLIYLNEKVQTEPFWYYYIEAFFLKTPLGILLLLLLAMLFYPWNNLQLNDYFIIVPLIFLIISVAAIRAQYGIKYLIPLYAFLYIFLARGILRMISIIRRRKRRFATILVIGLLLIFSAFSVLSSFPHFIPYFNFAVGSRDNGNNYISDLNVDWGQDLGLLAEFVDKEGIQHLQISYFGGGLPSYYIPDSITVNCLNGIPEGWFAISLTYRSLWLLYYQPEAVSFLESKEPYAIIGHSILLYYLDEEWRPSAGQGP